MFNSLVNYFIPKSARNDIETFRAARIFVIVLLVISQANLISIVNGYVISYEATQYMLLANSVLCIVGVFLFRGGLPLVPSTHLYIGHHAVTFFLQSWWGGGLESPGTIALFLLPATTMMLIGRRGAFYWFIFAIAALFFFYWYENIYGQLPVHFDLSKFDYYLLVSLIGIITCGFIIILVFDYEKTRAMHSLIYKNEELKSTQDQLIQKEKLASLGELTAGIAHEIQNPLNFVNNFSELSVDLAKELNEEIDKKLIDKELVKDLVADLSSNQQKINHHGKRASGIVKAMLEHSRTSTGERALTDINELADEYLRLSYHGLRAKDPSFNADYKTDFEAPSPKITIVPQDIGRVLLNLINNAFYAVHQRAQLSKSSQLLESYTPSVLVSTKQADNHIIIKVKDNGTGMPEIVKAKIFQPFFTTKPTGEGTGLGLSLAYDIVTKGHGGTLEVLSTEGVGSAFSIRLPFKTN